MKKIYKLLIVVLAGSLLLAVPAVVNAEEGSSIPTRIPNPSVKANIEAGRSELKQEMANKRAEAEKRRQEAKDKASAKNDIAKQKACENRTASYKKRMEGIAQRSERRSEVFNKISERVQAFTIEKNVTVPNYQQLLDDVALKSDALKEAQAFAKDNASEFKCDGDNAKTNVALFKESIAAEHKAFKEYKESIKNLIKAVKKAIEASKTGENNAQ